MSEKTAHKEDREKYAARAEEYWNDLSKEEQEMAFYTVCSRINKGDILEQGSYRYVLYDVFGFDVGMYGRGMDCGYFNIHNALFKEAD